MVTRSRDITAHTNSQSETAKVGAASTNHHLQTGGQKCMEKWNLVNGWFTMIIKLMKDQQMRDLICGGKTALKSVKYKLWT